MKSCQTQCLFYHEKVMGDGEIIWEMFLEFEDVLGGRDRCRIGLERIFTTGIAPE